MIVKNYMRDFSGKNPEVLIFMLIKSIPKILVPKNGFPNFNLTNSFFHSYGIMYTKFCPSGSKEEEEYFDFCRNNNVWAFTAYNGSKRGEVYLSLKERLEKDIYKNNPSIEHVVFHEIGHQFYYSRETDVKEIEGESLADIYANACMINLFQKNGHLGYYEKFSDRSSEILKNINNGKRIKPKNLLPVAEFIYRKYGVL